LFEFSSNELPAQSTQTFNRSADQPQNEVVRPLSTLLTLAAASPVAVTPSDEGSLSKRDTEILYLYNCPYYVSCCDPPKHTSHIFVRLTTLQPPKTTSPCSTL
jgi:hypothetical protein